MEDQVAGVSFSFIDSDCVQRIYESIGKALSVERLFGEHAIEDEALVSGTVRIFFA